MAAQTQGSLDACAQGSQGSSDACAPTSSGSQHPVGRDDRCRPPLPLDSPPPPPPPLGPPPSTASAGATHRGRNKTTQVSPPCSFAEPVAPLVSGSQLDSSTLLANAGGSAAGSGPSGLQPLAPTQPGFSTGVPGLPSSWPGRLALSGSAPPGAHQTIGNVAGRFPLFSPLPGFTSPNWQSNYAIELARLAALRGSFGPLSGFQVPLGGLTREATLSLQQASGLQGLPPLPPGSTSQLLESQGPLRGTLGGTTLSSQAPGLQSLPPLPPDSSNQLRQAPSAGGVSVSSSGSQSSSGTSVTGVSGHGVFPQSLPAAMATAGGYVGPGAGSLAPPSSSAAVGGVHGVSADWFPSGLGPQAGFPPGLGLGGPGAGQLPSVPYWLGGPRPPTQLYDTQAVHGPVGLASLQPPVPSSLPESQLSSPPALEVQRLVEPQVDSDSGGEGDETSVVDVSASFMDALELLSEVCPDKVRSTEVPTTAVSELDANLGFAPQSEGKRVLCESRLMAHFLQKFSSNIAGTDKQTSAPLGQSVEVSSGGEPRPGAIALKSQVAPPKQPYPSGVLSFDSLAPSAVAIDASDKQLLQSDKANPSAAPPAPPASALVSDTSLQKIELGARNALASASVLDSFLSGLIAQIQEPGSSGSSFALRESMDPNAVFQMARRASEALKDVFAQTVGVYGNSILLRRDIVLSSPHLGVAHESAQKSIRAAPLPGPGDGLFSRAVQGSLDAELARLQRIKAMRDVQRPSFPSSSSGHNQSSGGGSGNKKPSNSRKRFLQQVQSSSSSMSSQAKRGRGGKYSQASGRGRHNNNKPKPKPSSESGKGN